MCERCDIAISELSEEDKKRWPRLFAAILAGHDEEYPEDRDFEAERKQRQNSMNIVLAAQDIADAEVSADALRVQFGALVFVAAMHNIPPRVMVKELNQILEFAIGFRCAIDPDFRQIYQEAKNEVEERENDPILKLARELGLDIQSITINKKSDETIN